MSLQPSDVFLLGQAVGVARGSLLGKQIKGIIPVALDIAIAAGIAASAAQGVIGVGRLRLGSLGGDPAALGVVGVFCGAAVQTSDGYLPSSLCLERG